MREEFTLAMHRESYELERELVDRRIDEAFARVYDYLEPAANYLRDVCDGEARRALDQLELAYFKALEVAARSGIGCRPARDEADIPQRRPTIPASHADGVVATEAPAETDRVILVQPLR